MTDDEKKKEFYDLLDKFFDLDKRSDELKLFFAGHALNINSWLNRALHPRATTDERMGTLDPWLRRFVDWEDHIRAYHELEGGRYGTKRIEKLNKHLDVLDTKIGIALNFNSLLLAGVSLFAPWITNFGLSLCSSGRWVFEIFVVLAFFVLGLLVWNLGILFPGFRRVVWGRLGASTSNSQEQNSEKETEGKTETAEEGNKKAEKDEEDYVRFLIMSVARRTNCFRISTYITKVVRWSIALLLLMGAAVVVEHYRCHETIAGNAPSSVRTPGEGSVSITITGGDVQFGRVQSLNPKPFEPKSPDVGMPKLDPKLEAALWQHVQSPPTPTNTPRWIILFFIVLAVAALMAVIWWSLKRKPEATPLTVAIASLAAVSTAIEKLVDKGQIPPVGTVPRLVIVVASVLILVGVALFGAGLRWFFPFAQSRIRTQSGMDPCWGLLFWSSAFPRHCSPWCHHQCFAQMWPLRSLVQSVQRWKE